MWSPLSDSKRFLSGLCSLQLVTAAEDRDNKKKRKRLKKKKQPENMTREKKDVRLKCKGIKRKGMDVWRQGETTLKMTGLTQCLVGKMTEGL